MLRTVVEEKNFAADLDGYRRVYSDIEEVYSNLSLLLAMNPRLGIPLVQAPDYHIYQTDPLGNAPSFWIMYTFDTERVYLHSIEPVRKVEI